MSRFFVFFALVFVASVRPGIANEEGATACRLLVDAALYEGEILPSSVEKCNANEHCLDAQQFIGQHHGKPISGLTCAGAPKSSSQATAKFFYDAHSNACALAGIALVGPEAERTKLARSLPVEIALCNQHPNKSECEYMQSFVKSVRGDFGGLTCK